MLAEAHWAISRGRAPRPARIFIIYGIMSLGHLCAWASHKSRIVASSMFVENGEGWSVGGPQMEQEVFHTGPLQSTGKSAEVSDSGDEVWYFVAPAKFLGDKTLIYSGEFTFRMHHGKTPPPSQSHLMKRRSGVEGADVLLEADCGHSLYMSNVFDNPKGVSTQYAVTFHENSGWLDSRTRREVSQLDMLGTLANLKSIKIRGSFYKQPETVHLSSVSMLRAARSLGDLYPCCADKAPVQIEVCRSRDTSMTPKGTRFNCRGSLQPLVSIKSIFPRFARRSGGGLVTVKGENFGLSGSSSILRIGGRPASRCLYPDEEFPPSNPPIADTFLDASCRNNVLDTGEDKLDCGGPFCKPCIQQDRPNHCSNRILDTDQGETSLGSQANSLGVIYDCGGPCGQPDHCCDGVRNQDETGLDCGGPACLACSPLQRIVGTAVERQVMAVGSCSAEGCFCTVKQDSPPGYPCYFAINATLGEQSWNGSCIPLHGTCVPCNNGIYLSSDDPVTDPAQYQGKRIYLTGGVGSGQSATIQSYDPSAKIAYVTPWQASGRFTPRYEPGRNTTYTVGSVSVVRGGSGYTAGTWSLPSDAFGTEQIVDVAHGTFSVGSNGEILEADVQNRGHYEQLDYQRLGLISSVSRNALECDCASNDGAAVLRVSWRSDEIVPPAAGTTYMILDERGIDGSAWRRLRRVESVPQHETLVCETPAGEGSNQQFSVESQDETGALSTSCINDKTRGFEFGAHDFIWSLQMSMRQSVGIRAVQVSSMAVNENNGEIYVVGQIIGTCFESDVGCFGLVGSHLPNRGIANLADFTPLVLDPFGLTCAFLLKLDKRGVPLWLTQIDSSNRFGRVEPDVIRVDARPSEPRIYIAGLYSANRGSNIRFWNVDPETRAPRAITRAQAERGIGRCNVASCDGDVCTDTAPRNQTWQCDPAAEGADECGYRFCAWLEGYDNYLESQEDIFVAQVSPAGLWQWARTRISITELGTVFVPASVRLALAAGPIGSSSAAWDGAVYLSASIQLRQSVGLSTGVSDRPRQRLSLGPLTKDVFGLERNESDLRRVELSIPRSRTDERYAFVARLGEHGVFWGRMVGPFGADGWVQTLETGSTHGVYGSGVYAGNNMSFSSCAFTRLAEADRGDADSSGGNVSNTACFPGHGLHALYTRESWQATTVGQWDDATGNGRHGVVTRGSVEFVERRTGPAPRRYLKGTASDGVRFPSDSIPQEFTICSITRLASSGSQGVLEASDDAAWLHGHVAGAAGQAMYGSAVTSTEIRTIESTSWLVMCGQNDPIEAVANANGQTVQLPAAGDGGRQLAINDGLYSASAGLSEWEVIEIAIWDRFLTRVEVDGVVLYYRQMLAERITQEYSQKPLEGLGMRNLFLFSMDERGLLNWHREAVGGNLTASAMVVSKPEKRLGGRSSKDMDMDFTRYVYVAGQAEGNLLASFGRQRFPAGCVDVGPGVHVPEEVACSGQLLARGDHTDVFLAKYAADSGESIWLKRIGQRDILEEIVGMSMDDQTGQLFLAGNYANSFATETYRDVFDLVAAGRGGAVGCPMDRDDGHVKERLGRILTDVDIGTPNCSFIKNSRNAPNRAAFVMSVTGDNAAHGRTSRPWSLCSTPEEAGCNADGVLWAKNLGSGTLEPATMAETKAIGISSSRADSKASVLAMGIFRGFVQAAGTQGVKTPGVDDEGFFNCCLELGIPDLLDQVQDSWESYLMTLGD